MPTATTTPVCFRCDGTGLLCNACGESEAACCGDCQGEDDGLAGHYDCPDCGGTGGVKPAADVKPPTKAGRKKKK